MAEKQSRLAEVFQAELKGGRGATGGLMTALGKTALERIDPRNILFGGKGVGSLVGRAIFGKGYKAAPEKVTKLTAAEPAAPTISSEAMTTELKLLNKNAVVLPMMARDMNLMRQNMAKLVKLQGGKASTRADMFFMRAKEREETIEAQRSRIGPKAEKVSPQIERSGFDLKKMLIFLGITAIVSIITSLVAFFGKIKEKIAEVIQKVKDFFEDLYDGIKDIGTLISTGFANLIDNLKAGVKSALASTIETATSLLPDSLKKYLGVEDTVKGLRESAAQDRAKVEIRREERKQAIQEREETKETGRVLRTVPQEQQQKLRDELSSQGITDPKAQANILAQVQRESGFKPRSENLNYSGEKLFEMYGAGNKAGNKVRFQTLEEAKAVAAKGPEAIGNIIYGGRMGNAPDEGFKYRGRGLIQLTGKENYKKYGDMIGVDLVNNPDLANDPDIAMKIAAAYYRDKQAKGVNLQNIQEVNRATGFATGAAEAAKREQLAQAFLQQPTRGAMINTASEEVSQARMQVSSAPVIINNQNNNMAANRQPSTAGVTASVYNNDFNELLLRSA